MNDLNLQDSIITCRWCNQTTYMQKVVENHEQTGDTLTFVCPHCDRYLEEVWIPNFGSEEVESVKEIVEQLDAMRGLIGNVMDDSEVEDMEKMLDDSILKLQGLTMEGNENNGT